MDNTPKIYLTDEQHALQMAAWRDACEATAQVNARRDAWLEQSVAMEKWALTKLAAPPSDKERLWQAVVAAMQGSYASEYDDLIIVSIAFDIAESAVLEFHKRVARLDDMGWRTGGAGNE